MVGVRFWDTSALVPLLLDEQHTAAMLNQLREDPRPVVWWGTAAECTSAIRRRERQGLTHAEVDQGLGLLDSLASKWTEVQPSDQVKSRAVRLLAVHPLKSADAFQLSAALSWNADPGKDSDFVCLDERLADAARREGFRTLPTA